MGKKDEKLAAWKTARKRHRLSPAHVQMARELGMNPRKLGSKDNADQEPWKAPLPAFIEKLYRKRFGRDRPERVLTLEEYADEKARKNEARKAKRAHRKERRGWAAVTPEPSRMERFCEHWLPLWTGNRPDALIECYDPDAFYRDPARPGGIRGREALLEYFRRLLTRNPDWVWTAREVLPVSGGFVLKWHASIPAPGGLVEETGLDIVRFRDIRKNPLLILHNEVYFDRTALLESLARES